MSPKTESDELKKRVLDFLCDDIKKFFFIDCSSSKLNRKEIFGVIQGLQQDESADDSAKTLRNYQGSKNQAYYTWNREDLEEVMSNSPNLMVLELPEDEKIDKDQVKKILDLAESRLWKKVVLVSKKKVFFDDLVHWYHKAGMLKLNKEPDHQDLFPIHNIIVKDSSADAITDLVHKGAEINKQDENKDTPLHLAVENGAKHLVQHLLTLGAVVNIGNIQNRAVLQVALEKSFLDIANIVLKENVDVHLKDDNGCTALHLAARLGDVDIMKKLVEKGADVNTEDDFDCTPLMYACEGGKEAVEYLLPLIKDVDIQKTLIHAVRTGNGDVIDILVHSGADVNFQDADGFTPLFTAASHGNLSTVNALLNHGADPNKATTYCGTPLHSAVSKRHNEVVKKLLKAGSRVDAIFEGKNIVHVAAEQADKDILLALLENNADALSKDKEANTALHYSILNDCTDVIDVLIAQGIDINAKNDQFHTALYSACRYDIPDVVKRLICHKADVSIKENCLGWSPLHRACEEGHLDVVRVLLDAGASVNDVTKFKDTPLHRAVGKGHEGIVEELVRRGGDVTAVNGRGESVLDIARRRQSKKILGLLSKES